jgi:hypothetical protein
MSEVKVDSKGNKRWYKDGKLHREDGPALEEVNRDKYWYVNGSLHRIDGPAIECVDGSKFWYLNGKRHRLDGPAIEYSNGSKNWYIDGKLHREDGPAVEFADGHRAWWVDGKLHRIDGPAIDYNGKHKEWWVDGKLHRIDGPALEYSGGIKFWYINGDCYNRDKFNELVNFPQREIPYISFSNSIYHIKFKDNLGIRLSCALELYIDGEYIKWDWNLGKVILGFVQKSNYIEPLLDWIQENGRYFPSEFLERLYY